MGQHILSCLRLSQWATVIILVASVVVAGCSSGGDFVATTSGGSSPGGAVTVRLDYANALRGPDLLIGDEAVRFRFFVFSGDGSTLLLGPLEVERQEGVTFQEVTITGLPFADVIVRVVALDAGGNILGYQDAPVTVNDEGENEVTIGELIPGEPPPTPSPSPSPSGSPSPSPSPSGSPSPSPSPSGSPSPSPSPTVAFSIERVSRGILQSTDERPSMTQDGNLVVFADIPTDQTGGNISDVWVYDRTSQSFTKVDPTSGDGSGVADGGCAEAVIAAGGRFVAYTDVAMFGADAFPGDPDHVADVLLRDLQSATGFEFVGSDETREGSQPSISQDGRYVTLTAGSGGIFGLEVRDRQSGNTTTIVTEMGASSVHISADGALVAFDSARADLVAGDANNVQDVFVYDMAAQKFARVSVASDGTEGNEASSRASISADGRYIAFQSGATNLVSPPATTPGIYRHDRITGQTLRVDLDNQGNPGQNGSSEAHISADGNFVVFVTNDSLAPEDNNFGNPDVYLRDIAGGRTVLISHAADGTGGNSTSNRPFISGDGRWVAFQSLSNNLVTGDTNDVRDCFVARNVLAP